MIKELPNIYNIHDFIQLNSEQVPESFDKHQKQIARKLHKAIFLGIKI